jgi:GTP-dependent dephospho-CoA kinase
VLILKVEERSAFKTPFGDIYSQVKDLKNTLEKYKNKQQLIISIGDATTINLHKIGILPDISIIDNQIGRKKTSKENKINFYDNVQLHAENPPGTITTEMWQTITKAFGLIKSGFNVLIVVDGEEDLAVLPCVIIAPPGSVLLYGQPGEGVVHCEVDKYKDKAKELMDKFEGDIPWKSI